MLDCEGNSSDQTVSITFWAKHDIANQSLFIYQKDTKAFAKGQDYTNIDCFVEGTIEFKNLKINWN